MATQLENDKFEFDPQSFQQNLYPHYRSLLKDFKNLTKSYLRFHLIFTSIFLIEIVSFFYFFWTLTKSSYIAITLGALFLTFFSYFVLLFYYQAKKPDEILKLKVKFINSCKDVVGVPKGQIEHHLSIAQAAIKLCTYLHDFENSFYLFTNKKRKYNWLMENLGFFFHFEDVFKLKKHLLLAAIDQHLEQIRVSPTDLEVHTSLADTYVSLSKFYLETEQKLSTILRRKRFKDIFNHLDTHFQEATKRAVEEFHIINDYAPDDPWIHLQLAQSYRSLGMSEEEILEYETVLRLRPLDNQILFRLGILYFEKGQNAKGLKVYEQLKRANYKKAEDLICFYGVYKSSNSL